ncbi:MAG TPA: cytochrome P450 [Verrucomicrobiae bacterium]|nr:cytochrome P450 [Verrucomicrobiae bacterium]
MSPKAWSNRLWQQVKGENPFRGDCLPTRVSLFGFGHPTLPFPHLWNYKSPIKIFETFFWDAEKEVGSGKHNRYIYVAGLPPVLMTREPAVIRAVLGATGDKPGQFDRDQSPMAGIARATGKDSLLYSNGSIWRRQKRLSAEPFSRTNLFQPEKFHGFEQTFRRTVAERLEVLRSFQEASGKKVSRIRLEPEIKVVMLEMLVNNFFGGNVSEDELSSRFVPALEMLIDHMISDTVAPTTLAIYRVLTGRNAILRQKMADYEALTDIALSGRAKGLGLWK